MILHILRRSEWNEASAHGSYSPASLRIEGFIHCSTIAQLIDTANLIFRGQRDLIVLMIDESRLVAPLKYESAGPAGSPPEPPFPHIYGPLNVDAVTATTDLPCEADGSFRMQAAIAAAQRRG